MIPTSGTIPYAQSNASQEVPPPYHFPGVQVNAFVIDVSLPQVQQYCDSRFNLGAQETRGFVYKAAPAWPYALVLYLQYPQMMCSPRFRENMGATVSYAYRGVVSQTEVFLAIPVIRYGTAGAGRILDTTLEWALPFIVVGNPMSASCGREMLGMEKLLADIEIKPWFYPDSFSATLNLPGWKTGAGGEAQEMLPFMQVHTNPPMPTSWGTRSIESAWSLLETRAGAGFVQGLAGLTELAGPASMGTLPLDMRTISMKQFRDAADPSLAIYQSLVSCRSRYTNVEDFRVYNELDAQVVFHNFASFNPILQVFIPKSVLDVQPTVQFTPRAAYSLRATIDFDEMRTVYTAPMEPGPAIAPAPPGRDLVANWARPWVGLFQGLR